MAVDGSDDISNILPLKLINEEVVPPAPNQSASAADFLLDFAGLSWLAYGASSLLVISHFPSPESEDEVAIGTIFRQVIEPPHGRDGDVNAVAWAPMLPSSGEVASASGRDVRVYSCPSDGSSGSFCWRQIAGLAHSSPVEAVKWTGSCDGIVVAGAEITWWRRKNDSWESLWKLEVNCLQSLVSTTWSVEGLSATATTGSASLDGESSYLLEEARKCVYVYWNEGNSGFVKTGLCHPQPISMIQWRPLGCKTNKNIRRRDLLLTCCLDGTVRLWSEIDHRKPKKHDSDHLDQKPWKSFHVVTVVEMSHSLNGTLGLDIFLMWATEVMEKGDKRCFSVDSLELDSEWLIGVGPGTTLTLWAVHYLDDLMPLRFPRVTLWKKLNLVDLSHRCRIIDNLGGNQLQWIVKAIMSRSEVFGPPTTVSLVQSLPNNLICWCQQHIPRNHGADSLENQLAKDDFSMSFMKSYLNQEGYRGKIVQIAIHPCHELEIAISLDSNGTLILWSISSNSIDRSRTLFQPIWKLLGRLDCLSEGVAYTTVRWAPSLFHNYPLLLLGHAGGVDFVIISCTENNVDEIGSHKICTIPFVSHGNRGAPCHLYATFVSCTEEHNKTCSTFFLWCVWSKNFLALPWKIVLHEGDLTSNIDSSRYANYSSSFSSRSYYVTVDLCSSVFPDSNDIPQITSHAVICSGSSSTYLLEKNHVFQLATGFTNGSVKLWRVSVIPNLSSKSVTSLPFELVGVLHLRQGPITEIAISSCGRKIAIVNTPENNHVAYVHIWESKYLATEGRFMLEDKIGIDGIVIGLEWLNLGNGSLLLGVCLPEKLLIFASKRLVSPVMTEFGKPLGKHDWICVAVGQGASTIRGFQWGPKVTPLIIHDSYLCLFNQWGSSGARNGIKMDGAVEEGDFIKSSVNRNEPCSYNASSLGKICDPVVTNKLHNIIDIVETLSGPLPVYHPLSLMHFMSSGNFKRAYSAMELLLKQFNSYINSEAQRENVVFNFNKSVPSADFFLYSETISPSKTHKEDVNWANDLSTARPKQYDRTASHWEVYSSDTFSKDKDFSASTSKEGTFSSAIVESLHKITITNVDKEQLLASGDLLDEISNSSSSTYDSFDEPGRRFWVAVQYQRKYLTRKYGRISTSEDRAVDTGLMAWALHSDCQHQLLDSLLSTEPSWPEMKIFGAGYWFTDVTQLRARMEKIARSQYLKRKDPKDCILLYLALNRLQVLFGLFKLSKDEKDKPLVRFLSRNFQEEQNKAAALKNAYVLMGKHQMELAIAFFLLGGDSSSAVNICAKNYGDEQLALVICRLLEGSGGPLEHQIISNFLLPNALEKGDHWLASLYEWRLGNYSKSFWSLFYLQMDVPTLGSNIMDNYMIFLDPNIGQYCTFLASKTSMKRLVGDPMSALMALWGVSMMSSALKRCGLSLEALDFCASSLCTIENKDQDMPPETRNFHRSSWIARDVAYHLDSAENLALSLQHMSRLVKNHPKWPNYEVILRNESNNNLFEQQLEVFKNTVQIGVSIFSKYLVEPHDVFLLFFAYVCNRGSRCLALCIFHNYISECELGERYQILFPKLIMKSIEEANLMLCRFIFTRSISLYPRTPCMWENPWLCYWFLRVGNPVVWIETLGPLVRLYSSNYVSASIVEKIQRTFYLVEYCSYFTLAWAERDIKMINLMMQPILDMLKEGHDGKVEELHKHLDQVGKNMFPFSIYSCQEWSCSVIMRSGRGEQNQLLSSLPEDERWHFVAVILWSYFSKFFTNLSSTMCEALKDGDPAPLLLKRIFSFIAMFITKQIKLHIKQKTENGLPVHTLLWLRKEMMRTLSSDCLAESSAAQLTERKEHEGISLFFVNLWKASGDSKLLCEEFLKEVADDNCSDLSFLSWGKVYENIRSQYDYADSSACTQSRSSNGSGICESEKKGKSSNLCVPKVVYVRNGELLEGMSVNSVDQKQVAVATSRKGLFFFDLNIEESSKERADHIWSESDWPHNGWAGTKFTPTPNIVSPGIGLGGTKKETVFGTGGATVGKWSQARPGRDLTGGGAFGIPGYAGIGASGLGWEESENFDGSVDSPATIENISSRSLSSHPSRSLFLVGSNKTNIYLWEFGEAKAIATYGILSAANVASPFAVTSVSSIQFDHYGHRFASGLLDGTVCTWQLEIGGRSDVYPTESSHCFNNHTSDVAYAAASGSIIAAAGSSGNGSNIVIWDTLAPPSSSQASIICHEGGARSLSVFDNDIGSGSVSPMIVSGGRGGDICLHDFRFIATGRAKQHKQSACYDDKPIEERPPDGMIWYIPKAHQGSVMKIATIPNTSLFLTGGKDGNVKLWDAKHKELVFQWQKLHERHTFLQSSSRGFGGIMRAAVTDIQIVSGGFITCGGDGTIKLVQLGDFVS